MPRMTGVTFRRGDREYVLDLNWDDDAFVDGHIAIEMVAGWRTPGDDELVESVQASVAIEPLPDQNRADLVVRIGDKEVFRDDLAQLFGEDSILGRFPPEAFSFGDPILGCLIRSGISAAVGQIIDCKERTESVDWLWDRLRAIGRCLKENGVRIAARTLMRAGGCMIRI